jgi:hypothetical protein
MGLLAAMLGHKLVPLGTGRNLVTDGRHIRPLSNGEAEALAAGVPGPPPVPGADISSARAADLSLIEAGMRPITGGRRRSF